MNAGRPRWNREAIDRLLSNEKYTGRVLLQKAGIRFPADDEL